MYVSKFPLWHWSFLHEAGEAGISPHRNFRQEVMKLKHEPDAPVSKPGQLLFRQTEDIPRFIEHRVPRCATIQSMIEMQGFCPCPKTGPRVLRTSDFSRGAFSSGITARRGVD